MVDQHETGGDRGPGEGERMSLRQVPDAMQRSAEVGLLEILGEPVDPLRRQAQVLGEGLPVSASQILRGLLQRIGDVAHIRRGSGQLRSVRRMGYFLGALARFRFRLAGLVLAIQEAPEDLFSARHLERAAGPAERMCLFICSWSAAAWSTRSRSPRSCSRTE